MSIGSLLAAGLKRVPWTRVASLAVSYGPELINKVKDYIHARQSQPEEEPVLDQSVQRIRELEEIIVKQEKVIEQQQERISLLEQASYTLEARIRLLFGAAAVCFLAALVLAGVLISR